MPCWMSCSPAAGRKPAEKKHPAGVLFRQAAQQPGPAAEPPPGFARRPRAEGSGPPSRRDGGRLRRIPGPCGARKGAPGRAPLHRLSRLPPLSLGSSVLCRQSAVQLGIFPAVRDLHRVQL